MKRFFVTIVILFSMLSRARAQAYIPFPDSGAVWTTQACFHVIVEGGQWINLWEFYSFSGDTVVNSTKYHLFSICCATEIIGMMRTDSLKRTYLRFSGPYAPDSTDHPIYDFSLSAGDTLFDSSQNVRYITIVDSIDTVLVNNSSRAKFSVRQYQDSFMRYDTWIEGIGSLTAPAGHYYDEQGDGFTTLCEFMLDSSVIYGGSAICDLCGPNNLIYSDSTMGLDIYPNPVNDNLYIVSHDPEISVMLTLINAVGQKLNEQVIGTSAQIDMTGFSQGVYFLEGRTDSGARYVWRIVKI